MHINNLNDFSYASKRYASFATNNRAHFLYLSPLLLEYSKRLQTPLHGVFNTKPYQGHWNETGYATAAKVIENEMLHNSEVLSKLGPSN